MAILEIKYKLPQSWVLEEKKDIQRKIREILMSNAIGLRIGDPNSVEINIICE